MSNVDRGGHQLTVGSGAIAPAAVRVESGLVAATAVLFAASGPAGISWPLIAAVAVVTAVAVALRASGAASLGGICAVWLAVHRLIPFRLWPLHLVIVLIAYAAFSMALARRGRPLRWQQWGRLDRRTRTAMAVCVVIPAIALVAWWRLAKPDLGTFQRLVPAHVPLPLILAGIGVVAVLNAATEEFIFRGALLDALDASFGASWGTVFAQAATFGLWHFRGFPSGWIGVALAFVFAMMMGALRRMGRGMGAPWITHVFADCTIYTIVASIAVSTT